MSAPPMLVNCPNCRTQLQCPPMTPMLRCGICSVTFPIAQPAAPAPAPMPAPAPAHAPHYAPYPGAYGGPAAAAPGPAPVMFGGAPRKRALLIGINYIGTANQLRGCINDVKCFKFMLMTRFGFPEANIIVMTEESPSYELRPTRVNILHQMRQLVSGVAPGDSLVFQYSGHGSQARSRERDEADGMDETILPVDFQTAGQIIDNEVNDVLVRPIPAGVRLHAVIDACHSGTVLDLQYLSRGMDAYGRPVWEEQRAARYKGTAGGEVICFSGCADSQTSADTAALSRVASTGAMTFALINAVERGHAATYASTLQAMKSTLGHSAGARGPASLVDVLLGAGAFSAPAPTFTQVPQISSSAPFDLNRPFSL